ncbi:cell division protein FtsL [Marinimicrobium alkaliphilum]|uniref:cell division protein FtsL n=1 Tax=Marinimicrobium alkaliphilum TaxID=2202654 RepID=UPI000DB988EE|nr:cell division protein FtsL [Marinimicrobium alkaliphilum]
MAASLNRQRLNLRAFLALAVLWALVVGSALAVVSSTHEVRQQVNHLEGLRRDAAEAQVEWGKYLLEQSTWAAYGRIERIATAELKLQTPSADQILVVTP